MQYNTNVYRYFFAAALYIFSIFCLANINASESQAQAFPPTASPTNRLFDSGYNIPFGLDSLEVQLHNGCEEALDKASITYNLGKFNTASQELSVCKKGALPKLPYYPLRRDIYLLSAAISVMARQYDKAFEEMQVLQDPYISFYSYSSVYQLDLPFRPIPSQLNRYLYDLRDERYPLTYFYPDSLEFRFQIDVSTGIGIQKGLGSTFVSLRPMYLMESTFFSQLDLQLGPFIRTEFYNRSVQFYPGLHFGISHKSMPSLWFGANMDRREQSYSVFTFFDKYYAGLRVSNVTRNPIIISPLIGLKIQSSYAFTGHR